MKKIKKILLISVIFYAGTDLLKAQVHSSNQNIWFHYVGKTMITNKTSVTLEATMRYANGFSEKQQWFLRPSVDYQCTKKFTASIGYTHYNTYSYGNPSLNKTAIPEDHVWLQGFYSVKAGAIKITQRLRDENRWVGIPVFMNQGYVISRYEYRNRLRYMFMVNVPLINRGDQTKLFALAGDEAFLNIGKFSGKTLLNQNRIIAGLGFNISSAQQVQFCYVHQHIWNFSNTIVESNPTLRISYINNFSLIKNKK